MPENDEKEKTEKQENIDTLVEKKDVEAKQEEEKKAESEEQQEKIDEKKTEEDTTKDRKLEKELFPNVKSLEKFQERVDELIELDKKITEKIKIFDKRMAENALAGKGLSGDTIQETGEEKAKRKAKEMLEGTGLNPFLE